MSPRQRLGALLAAAIGALAILALPGAAAAKDRNHDRIPDRWEKRHRLSLAVNQAHRDQDHDGLNNRAEFMAGDNPRNPDSDGDGIPDGEENAGKIASFDPVTGTLTIDLFGGETLSGLVTEETEIECERSGSSAQASDSGNGEGDEASGEEGGEGDAEGTECGPADLVPEAVVKEAELSLVGASATFDEVKLAG